MHAVMTNKKNKKSQCPVEPNMRITRARAKSLGLPPLHPPGSPEKRVVLNDQRTNPSSMITRARAKSLGLLLSKPDEKALPTKRAASGSAASPEKQFVLFKNETHYNPSKEEGSLKKKRKLGPSCEMSLVPGNKRETKINFTTSINLNFKNERLCEKEESMDDVIDIDSKHNDPLMFSLYAKDIYYNMHTAQLARRPLVDYIEKVQRDITQDMRAVLIDWLIKVSDECRMVPDTVYLTVNLIDRFLSHFYIEEKKLELLGITCLVIASKYEDISAKYEDIHAPRLQDLHKEEVLQMERCVLNLVGFQLSVPTTKEFLRRFIQASHVSCKAPCAELEFLANYLAELTLTEYGFLKFLPSQIAASAVFLARWTLDQSQHPWNPTLEHYTRHKTPELKMAVLELQELQLNTRGCVTVRGKYRQSELMCVSTLRSSKSVQSLF